MTPAQAIKSELKEKFPKVKFSVRYRSFAGGDAVDVGWTNGPTEDEVNAVTKKYQEGSFDGSRDLYEYDNTRSDLLQAKYVQTQRDITDDKREEIKNKIAQEYGIENVNDEAEWRKTFQTWSDQAIWRELSKTSF